MANAIHTLLKALTLIAKAIDEEKVFGEGANYIVLDHAERMVSAYETACADGTINDEPIGVAK